MDDRSACVMVERLRDFIGVVRHRSRKPVAPPGRLAYLEPGNQWYGPVLAGVSSLAPQVLGAQAVRRSRSVLERLDCDEYHQYVMNFYRAGLDRLGDGWTYADLYTTLAGLTTVLRPDAYLEIGVRRGHSMSMVAAHAPQCSIYGFDLWVQDYAGLHNPGKAFVEQQLARVGFTGRAQFTDGDSASTVPSFLAEHPDLYFDLITVDGDHSARGARLDLGHVLPRLKVGGVVVFDDLINPAHPELLGVWNETVASRADMTSWTFAEAGFGVAFALRTV
jgi:predicted O-methyltransferase YrrM